MKKYLRILRRLTTEVWSIDPALHRQIIDLAYKRMYADDDGEPIDIEGLIKDDAPILEVIDGIAKINVIGVIGQHLSLLEKVCGGIDVKDIEKAVSQAVADDNVNAILIYVDSPGGCVVGVPELAETIKAATNVKPVFAFTDSQACSAGYWIIAGADEIHASQSACLGSIGAYMAIIDYAKAFDMAGLKTELFANGKYKGAGLMGTSLSEAQKENFQASVDSISGKFKAFVKDNRNGVSEDTMQGQCFYGYDAIGNGLIDNITTLDGMIDYVKGITKQG